MPIIFNQIEAPRRKQRGIFDRKDVCYFWIRSLTPPQAAGNALAFAVQKTVKDDKLVKSRHSGRSRIESGRSPDGLQLIEKTGLRLSPE